MADGYRLSLQQSQLWAIGRHGGDAWIPHLTVRLIGDLDHDRLRSALERIVRRHESLRTTLVRIPGLRRPVQQIEERAEARRAEPGTPVPVPSRGPGLDYALVRNGDGDQALVISLPAFSSDLASLDNLFLELVRGLEGSKQEDAVQYLQYSEWQHELLVDAELGPVRELWRERLAHMMEAPLLAGQRSDAASQPFAPDRLAVDVEAAALRRLIDETEATGQDVLLAAWQVVLSRFTDGNGPLLGWLSDGRSQEELKASLGCFAKRLPLWIPRSAGEPFTELVVRVRDARSEAEELQDGFLPGAEDGGEGRPLHWPFGFHWRQTPATARVGGLSLAVTDAVSRVDRCLLELVATQGERGISMEIHWDRAAHAPELTAALGSSLAALIAGAAAAPRSSIENLPLLTPEDRRLLGAGLSGEAQLAKEGSFVHRLLEERANRQPEALAVDIPGSPLTFGRLEAAANRLAHHLRAAGVGPDVPVGICVDHSELAVIALLGVLKAGGAYLALEPIDPDERRRFLLEDSGASVLALGGAANEPPAGFTGTVIRLEAFSGVDAADAPRPPAVSLDPENLAYVIYTSGSTGLPKGVGVSHRSLLNYLLFVDRVLWPEGSGGWPWISRLGFDACLKQIFSPLLRGQPVWLLPEEISGHALGLLEALGGKSDVALNCVPTLWCAMLDGVEAGVVEAPADRLSRLLLGGEKLEPDVVARTRSAFPGIEIWNLYGPCEATANATAARIGVEPSFPGVVPLGRPVDGARIVLVDPRLEPIPTGVVGEILLGGAGLARGYLGKVDLTAERFVPDPFPREPGARLYRTGDLGRLLPTGDIEFLTRVDEQVKVRGIRIELGEIEAALRAVPAVRDAAVAVRQEPSGDRNLVAYLVARPGATIPGTGELRSQLRQRLPDSLIPAAFMQLNRFPLTHTGKVDRRALPTVETVTLAQAERRYVAPRNEDERVLAEIWAGVLGREQVGIEDDFFELGGHSLQSIQITYQARQKGFRLSPRDLFQNPTIALLARLSQVAAYEPAEELFEEGEL
jgi:amino acid adenylation domain-containing protein